MKLRARLVVSSIAALVVTVLVLAIWDAYARHRAAQALMTEIVSGRIASERAQCEADPAGWGGTIGPRPTEHDRKHGERKGPPPSGRRPRPLQVWVYDDSLRAHATDAPAIDRPIGGVSWFGDDVESLVPTPWQTGPCAYILARGSTGDWGAVLPPGWLWLLPGVIVVAAVVIVVGPTVQRIRRLTRDVEHANELGAVDPGGDEVGALSRAFAAATQRIREQLDDRQRRERSLREFMANTTHDLMIPLTVLQGHLAALANESTDKATARAAMNEAHYMAGLVHNLQTVAKLDIADDVVQRHPVDLRDVVTRVVARHRPIARAAGIALEEAVPAEPLVADVDVTLLEQAISNLTYNAVRYNHAGGHVAVVLEPTDDRGFTLRVVDDGPGIAAAELEKLLARGGRGDLARTRAPAGQGLGLDIALRVTALHGFALALRAAEPHGLDACVTGYTADA